MELGEYNTIKTVSREGYVEVIINRLERRNAINTGLIADLNKILDVCEPEKSIHGIILKGQNGIFCTGMDFKELMEGGGAGENLFSAQAEGKELSYMQLLKRFSLFPKLIISALDGQVTAGGVGFVAASDMVFATSATNFTLSEAIWGLLPACVAVFLVRRIGFQKAYRMSFSTKKVEAEEALHSGLIDEISDNLDNSIRKFMLYTSRIDQDTVVELKQYFRKIWFADEKMEQFAIDTITRLTQSDKVRNNISEYINKGKLPWEE